MSQPVIHLDQLVQPQRRGSTALLSLLTLMALSLLAGCATTSSEPQSMLDPDADFNSYETFGWLLHTAENEPISIVESKLRDAIVAEMEAKGYSPAADGEVPDILIDYEAASRDTVKSRPFRIGIGVGSYGSHGGASIGTSTSGVKNITEGSLTIHVVDSDKGAEVWRSGISREIDRRGADEETIKRVVAEVFADLPAKAQ